MQKASCFGFVAGVGGSQVAQKTSSDEQLEAFAHKYGKSFSSAKTFAGIHASKSFTVEAAHKAFAGLKHKK